MSTHDLPESASRGTRSGPEEKRLQGHWLLAKLGKRVLRPGGIGLTRRMVLRAEPTATDRIVGPGSSQPTQLKPGCPTAAPIWWWAKPC